MDIFVGNLSFDATQGDIKKLFAGFGSVVSVRIVMEKKRTKSRGFGFVQMPDEQQALAAIAALNGKEFMGRPLNVSPARPKPVAERDNPMRWRKKYEQPKPWQKSHGEAKPWRKSKKRPRPRQSRIESRRKPGGYTR